MPDILVRNLSEETVARLKEQAERHRRSLQGELAVILERETISRGDFLTSTRKLRDRIAKANPKQASSVDLIREDRNR